MSKTTHRTQGSLLLLTGCLLASGCTVPASDPFDEGVDSPRYTAQQFPVEPNKVIFGKLHNGTDVFAWTIGVGSSVEDMEIDDGTDRRSLSPDTEYWFTPTNDAGEIDGVSSVTWTAVAYGTSSAAASEVDSKLSSGDFAINEDWTNPVELSSGDWDNSAHSPPSGSDSEYYETTISGRTVGLWVQQNTAGTVLEDIVWTTSSTTNPQLPSSFTGTVTLSSDSTQPSYHYDSNP